ncbi:MAG: hypothetical protein IPL40_10655 [Proteobacteria bacterium]|nr:hypothetical protein [Pseudomonadota bacterium]
MSRLRLGEILIQAGVLEPAGLERALQEQRRWGRGPLGQYLVQLGLVSEEMIVRALSRQFNIPAVALDPELIDLGAARFIPDDICQRHRLVCIKVDRERRFLDVAMADPASLDAVDEVRVATRYNVRPYFALPSAIERALGRVYEGVAPLGALAPASGAREFERGSAATAPRLLGRKEISFDEVSVGEIGALDVVGALEGPAPIALPAGLAPGGPGRSAPQPKSPPTAAMAGGASRALGADPPAPHPRSPGELAAGSPQDDHGAQLAQLERQLRAQSDRFSMLLQLLRSKGMLSGDDLSRLGD